MGGIGKTTIAEALFDQISEEFESKFFVANVREKSEKMGLENLQKEIISYLLDEHLEVGGPNIPKYIKDKFQSKKVLVVLDDVNKLRQLEYLARGLDRFHSGSRVIITTRDKDVLVKFRVNQIYQVEELDHNEALQHFYNFAFSENQCPKDLIGFSMKVADFAKGNPLVLKVLGSFFYEKSKPDWEKALNYLEQIPDTDTYGILKVSYDELEKKLQNIFFDIACFFKGDDKDHFTSFLDDPCLKDNGLDVLVRKSLITISNNNLKMHDLLQEMGREIVRQESEEPGKRSRLWDHKDILRVLTKNKGTDLIKGIFLDLSKIRDHVDLNSKVFANMPNLRLLKFYITGKFHHLDMSLKVHLPRGLDCLSDELRYLYWHGYPLKTLPMRFNPENLIELNLPYSKVEQLWYRKKKAYELKSIDLHHSQYLVRIPDSSEIPKLERLNLLNCTKLPYISSSIQNFNYLGVLSLEGCTSIRCFPRNIHFNSPVTIDLSYCVNLTEFPQISGNVTTLNLIETAIEEVPSSVENLTNFKMLNLRFCERLKTVSSSICKLKSLCDLELGRCPKLESFPEILEKMERLKYIGLKCTKIRELPSSIENVEGLQRLILTDCSELNSLPQELWSLKSLKLIHGERSAISQLPSSFRDLHRVKELKFSRCRGLVLPPFSGLSSLMELELDDCGVSEIPQDIGCLSSLEVLNLKGNNFVSLPSSMKQLSRLKELRLRNCSMLESLPELPPCIVEFDAANCEQLQSLPELPSRPADELHASILEKLETLCKQSQYDVMKGMELAVLEFSNCMKLNENNILEDSQLWIQHMAVASLRRFFEEEEEEDDDDDEVMDTRKALGFSICLPGRGIPEWFSNKSSGCSIQLCCSRNFIGFALCVVLASAEVLHGGKFDGFVVECDYRFETTPFSESTCVYRTFFFETLNNDIFGDLIYESDHVCLGFDPCSHDGLSDGDHLTAISVDFSIHHKETIKVKCCGVCPIYAHPIESKPDTFTVNMVPLTEECRKLDIEAHDEASTSGTTTESGSIEGSDEEEINASQQQSSFLSQIFRCWGIDCNCL